MSYFILKAALSGVLIAIISEVASGILVLGGLIASLPSSRSSHHLGSGATPEAIVSQVAAHARATLWYVVPSLPSSSDFALPYGAQCQFLASPLFIASLITICLYLTAVWLAERFGITFEQVQ